MHFRSMSVFLLFSVSWAVAAPLAPDQIAEEAVSRAAEERVQAMSERLELTDEQRPDVEAIIRKSGEKRRAILETFGLSGSADPKLSRRQKRELRDQLQELSRDTTSALCETLTEMQMAEWKAVQQEQADALRKRLR